MQWRNAVAIVAIPIIAAGVAATAAARAQTRVEMREHGREVTDLLLRVNGPVRVAAGDSANTVWVVKNDAAIDGTVREQLMVVNGTARVAGTVRGDVTVVNGHLDLAPTAQVGGDVLLYGSTVTRAPGAQVAGAVHTESGISFGARAMWFLWVSMTLLVVLVGLASAWIAGRQLAESAALIGHEPLGTALSALVLWGGLPMLAIAAFMTIVGIPLGFAVLFFLIPLLTLAGYVVAGAAVGGVVVRRLASPAAADVHPFRVVALGLLLLQLFALVPGVGGPVAFLAGLAGAGAIAYRTWLNRPRRTAVAATGAGVLTEARA